MTDEQKENLRKFCDANKPRTPAYLYRFELAELKSDGYSYSQILDYLRTTYDYKTTTKTIQRVLKLVESSETNETKQTTTVKKSESNTNTVDFFTAKTN